jgi:predicted PurR-regulated permease PerM
VDAQARTWERHRVQVTLSTAIVLIGVAALAVIARGVYHAAHTVLGWAAASIVVATLLDLPISLLARRIGRVAAVALTFVAAGALVLGLVYGAFDDLRTEIDRLAEAAPQAAAELEDRDDRVGEVARDLQLSERVERLVDEIEDRFGGGGGQALLSNAGSLPTYFLCAILTIFLMSYGPRMVTGGLAQIRDDERRVAVADVLGRALVRSRGAIFAAIAQGVLVGVGAWLACLALDLPAPITVALVAGLLGLIPYLGIILASLLIALLATGFVSATAGLLVLAAAVALQVFEAQVVRPGVDRATMRIGPAVPWLVAVIGYSVYGVGGALYGAAYAVFALAVMDAIAVHRRAASIAKVADDEATTTASAAT